MSDEVRPAIFDPQHYPEDAEAHRKEQSSLAAPNGSVLPCPFCGSARVEVRAYNQPSVVCFDCLAMGPAADRLLRFGSNIARCNAQAIERWNRRER